MGINNLMDRDRAAAIAAEAAAAAEAAVTAASVSQAALEHQPHLLSHQHLQPTAFDRGNSPHGSEASYHSPHRPYGSPSAIPGQYPHGQLPLPDPNIPSNTTLAGLPAAGQGMSLPYNTSPEAPRPPPVKAYPCSTCAKRFARRSDLARHGKYCKTTLEFCA